MTDDPPPLDAESYIRANRDRFTRDAIAARLIEAGHDPAAVETALERVLAVDAGASPAPKAGSGARLLAKLLVIAALGAAGWILTAVVASFAAIEIARRTAGEQPSNFPPLLVGAGNIVILVLIALGLFRLINRRRGGQLVGIVLLTLLVLAPLATLGLCSATLMLYQGA